jgi:radical SAM protein with 4Fe4S-binding SPASM domain
MARGLADAGLTGFQVSLPAASGSTFEAICGQDALHDAMNGILAASATALPVSAAFTICSLNSAEAGDALQMAFALGASSFQLIPLAPGGRATRSWDDVAPSRDQLKMALDLAGSVAGAAGTRVYTGIVLPPCEWQGLIPDVIENCGCLGAGPKWAVDPWGEVRPCEQVGVGLGSMLNRDFESIAVSDEAERFRRSLQGQGCADCESLRSCRGGCRAYGSGACGTRPSVSGSFLRGESTLRG